MPRRAHGIGPATREPAVLLTSELVTNGIIHGRTEVEVRLDITEDAVRVEVTDSGKEGCPVAEDARPDADRGRGLMIVSRLASSWGVELSRSGTAVWFELRCSRTPSSRRSPFALGAIAFGLVVSTVMTNYVTGLTSGVSLGIVAAFVGGKIIPATRDSQQTRSTDPKV